jgi:FXSXX-COOH protein
VESAPVPDAGADQAWVPLVDVSDLPILAVSAGDETALGRSLRQVIKSLDDPNGVISAFDSFASVPQDT